jgi:hypothetical protein
MTGAGFSVHSIWLVGRIPLSNATLSLLAISVPDYGKIELREIRSAFARLT